MSLYELRTAVSKTKSKQNYRHGTNLSCSAMYVGSHIGLGITCFCTWNMLILHAEVSDISMFSHISISYIELLFYLYFL